MRKIIMLSLAAAGAAVIGFSGAGAAMAESGSSTGGTENESTTETEHNNKTENESGEHRSGNAVKLADKKLRACQNREKSVNNIMSRISDRGQKQLDLFTKIADRTEAFYVSKGKTLSNYDTLVADVTAKKTAAQTAVDTVKANKATFKCDGTDPKGAAATFKESLKSEIASLKDYKTSVKNLIVGVKSVQSTVKNSDGGDQ